MSDLRLSQTSDFFNKENPLEEEIYMVLEEMDIETCGDVAQYLNTISPRLTICPKCQVDDFTHMEGCELNKRWNPE